jgi:hypothetical protein
MPAEYRDEVLGLRLWAAGCYEVADYEAEVAAVAEVLVVVVVLAVEVAEADCDASDLLVLTA